MNPRSGISAFLGQVDRHRRLARVLLYAAIDAIVVVCAVWLVELLAPAYLGLAVGVAAIYLSLSAVVRYRRSKTSVADLDREFGCADALITWAGRDVAVGGEQPAMAEWLEADLAVHLDEVSVQTRGAPVRRRLRPLRYLVPILLALLILRWLQPTWLTPPLGGGAGGGSGGSQSASVGGSGAQSGADGSQGSTGKAEGGSESSESDGSEPVEPVEPSPSDAESSPPTDAEPTPGESESPSGDPVQPPSPEPPSPEPTPPDPEPADTSPEPSPNEPEMGTPPNSDSPLLDLAIRDDFVIPQFLGAGPSKRDTAHVAEVGAPAGGDPAPDQLPSGSAPRGGTATDPDSPLQEEQSAFERAAERALRSRHIGDAERAVVRRYFELVLRGRR